MTRDTSFQSRELGRGRSAVVYLDQDEQGRLIARKVFVGEGLSKIVLFVLTGSANPYTWCEAAMRAAAARRRVLEPLVKFWFDEKVRLPRTDGWGYNEKHRAYELRSELIVGRHVPLRSAINVDDAGLLGDLTDNVMQPLQAHLADSGFDGLLWQAGRGNPVAASNFMQAQPEGDEARWVWIDLESGVPALFALNPLATLAWYLPKSIAHNNWLFDDVDVKQLRRYLDEQRDAIAAKLGDDVISAMGADVEELDAQQFAWKSLRRHQRSIRYEHSRGRISDEQAAWFDDRPVRWYARLAFKAPARVGGRVVKVIGKAAGWLARMDWLLLLRWLGLLVISQRFRSHLARSYVARRIRGWSQRKFLDRAAARELRHELRDDDVSSYLTDFGAHLAIKPFMKILQWWVCPALAAMGVISLMTLAVIIIMGGPAARTAYTFGRLIQATVQRRRRPWVALFVGLLPMAGNTAYPAQFLFCCASDTRGLARFMLDDMCAAIGRAIPIWGGSDSLIEHWFNRVGNIVGGILSRVGRGRRGEDARSDADEVVVRDQKPVTGGQQLAAMIDQPVVVDVRDGKGETSSTDAAMVDEHVSGPTG